MVINRTNESEFGKKRGKK
jgi:hypothetical protein